VVGLFGLTPAHVAAYCGHLEILEMLLSAGADTNAQAGAYTRALFSSTLSLLGEAVVEFQ